jgi:hypothetical protein
MIDLTIPVKHSDIVWNNWPAQFVRKRKLEALVYSVAQPLDSLAITLAHLQTKTGVFTSQGKQLDGVGAIVGQPRYLPGAFLLPFFGYESQPATTGYNQARYRREGESNEDTTNTVNDSIYQLLINWKIVMNTSNGTTEDVIRAMRAIFPDAVKVTVTMPAPRTLKVDVKTRNDVQPLFAANLQAFVPKTAGHTVIATVAKQ